MEAVGARGCGSLVNEHGGKAAGRPSGDGDSAGVAAGLVGDARRVVAALASAAAAVKIRQPVLQQKRRKCDLCCRRVAALVVWGA